MLDGCSKLRLNMNGKQPEKLYRKLIKLYPRDFRERFGESMEQTFADLCNEWANSTAPSFGYLVRFFANTAVGVLKENLVMIRQKTTLGSLFTDPWRAAAISMLLCVPFAISAIPLLNVAFLADPIRTVLTFDGQQLSMFGRLVVFGGVLLLPFALLLNLVPMFTTGGVNRRFTFSPRPINLITGIAVLIPVLLIARWMVFEATNCSKGICD